jgi:heptosyltransferase-2
MSKIAIIKIGATGDVVRTSVLLHLYKDDDITWITAHHNIPILPFRQPNLKRVIALEDIDKSGILNGRFDLVISLDDDLKCAELATRIKSKELFGAYTNGDAVLYTSSSDEWFNMGLSSRFGKEKADQIKWENQYSYQEILFRMLGHSFNGEEYIIPEDIISKAGDKVIGIESRAGARWPTKMWNQYRQLADVLENDGYECIFFKERENIKDYLQDIGNVSLFISGDTLGMHIALALKIPVVAIFTCTSAVEIYGYNRMKKIVSPFLDKAFYKTDYIAEAVESISLSDVYSAVRKINSAIPQ